MNEIIAYLEPYALTPEILLGLFGVWNILVFIVYAMDKSRAKARRHRISERLLLVLTILAGGVGAIFAMLILRHKTKTAIFRIIVPIALVLQVLGVVLLWNYFA